MKTTEELNVIKEEVEALNKKLAELNDEEMAYISGGLNDENSNRWDDWCDINSGSPNNGSSDSSKPIGWKEIIS